MSIDISGLLSFLFGAGLLLGIVLLIRGITLWYFKIDIHILPRTDHRQSEKDKLLIIENLRAERRRII